MSGEDSLLREFETPSRAAWEAAAARELRGRKAADLDWQTDDGLRFPVLFTREDAETVPHRAAAGVLGTELPWAIRQGVDVATPELAGRLTAAVGRGDADELMLVLDRGSRLGLDPVLDGGDAGYDRDTEPGVGGCALYHSGSLEVALGAVDLSATKIALDAGASTLAAFAMLGDIARRRGTPLTDLRLELGLDPLRDAIDGSPGRDPEGLLEECSAAITLTQDLPRVTPLAAHSAPYHDAGASAAQELAYTLSTAIAYRRSGAGAGAICLRFAVDTDIYVEVAKLRAARLLWAKISRAFGDPEPRVQIHGASSRRSWSGDDVHTNLLRSGVQGFIAAVGGCDSIQLAPFDRNFDEADLSAQALARNQLVLLREEALLHRVDDPCAGAFAFEAVTDRIARQAWEILREVDRNGGMLAALGHGTVQRAIGANAERRRQELRTGARDLVGTTRFVDSRFRKGGTSAPDREAIAAAHAAHLAGRDADPDDPMPSIRDRDSLIDAAGRGATTAELTRALRGAARFRITPEMPAHEPEGAAFEALRDLTAAESIRVQPILLDDGRSTRARYEFVRDLFAVGGFTVLDPVGIPADPAAAADLTVVCGEDDDVDRTVASQPDGSRLVVAGRPRDGTRDRVAAHLFRGGDNLRELRSLYLAVTPEPPEGEQ